MRGHRPRRQPPMRPLLRAVALPDRRRHHRSTGGRDATPAIEILPPLADGSWWLVQCHRCREIVGEAVASQWEAERVADHHTRSHTNNAIPAGNRRLRAWLTTGSTDA